MYTEGAERPAQVVSKAFVSDLKIIYAQLNFKKTHRFSFEDTTISTWIASTAQIIDHRVVKV